MGSLRLTLCTGVLAVTALTPAAYATDGGVAVTPASPAPGTDIALRMDGCTETTATAVSAAFVADARLTVADGTLVGETRIRSALTAGVYQVKVTCGTAERKVALTVVDKATHPARPTAPASPVAPVHAGGGGTARVAAADDTRADGPGTGHTVAGLMLAGVAAVTVVLLGSRRSRRTG
jgi:hypothetical protein